MKSVERKIDNTGSEQSLLTPARRTALDALEREFQELLHLAARLPAQILVAKSAKNRATWFAPRSAIGYSETAATIAAQIVGNS